jgi:hypothetical protein
MINSETVSPVDGYGGIGGWVRRLLKAGWGLFGSQPSIELGGVRFESPNVATAPRNHITSARVPPVLSHQNPPAPDGEE